MLKENTWYKSPEIDKAGLLAGTYTYFKISEFVPYTTIKVDIYDLARDTGLEDPFITVFYEKKQIEPVREVSEEEIGHSFAFIAKILLSGA